MDRLRNSRDFSRVQSSGKKLRSHHLLMICLPNRTEGSPGLVECRLGFTVSRKVGNAVQRNQIKRWLREAVRVFSSLIDGYFRMQRSGVDVVIIPRSEALAAGYHKLLIEIKDLFIQAGFLPKGVASSQAASLEVKSG